MLFICEKLLKEFWTNQMAIPMNFMYLNVYSLSRIDLVGIQSLVLLHHRHWFPKFQKNWNTFLVLKKKKKCKKYNYFTKQDKDGILRNHSKSHSTSRQSFHHLNAAAGLVAKQHIYCTAHACCRLKACTQKHQKHLWPLRSDAPRICFISSASWLLSFWDTGTFEE